MTRADSVLVLMALLLVAASFYFTWRPSATGSTVAIYRGDTLFRQHDLHESATIHVPGKLGDSIIEVADGRARFLASPCQTKFCVHAGWIQHTGEIIACLPNGVYIEIPGGVSRFDALAF